MKLAIYDPLPMGNEYCTKMFLRPIVRYAIDSGIAVSECCQLDKAKDSTVVLLTDHLSEERILTLKNNGNKIVGINVTDSSYISGQIRYAKSLQLVDLIFMVSGVPVNNNGSELAIDDSFNVTLVDKPFLDEENWRVFDFMRRAGRLQSLPYVPWTPIPDVPRQPWSQRSQKAILRGGGHARRFILALFLQLIDKLDPNSGFVLHPYFADDMNPQFQYCNTCRKNFRENGHKAVYKPDPKNWDANECNSPARFYGDHGQMWTLKDLGHWNNRCPRSFFWMAEQFQKRHGSIDMAIVEKILNARWLDPKEHLAMLGRILFSSDLKWEHSIFMPQRFWEAASAGCINILPLRTINQEYFPRMKPGEHYLVFEEDFRNLDLAFRIDEQGYNHAAGEMRRIYDEWIQPTNYAINSNLLAHIIGEMRKL